LVVMVALIAAISVAVAHRGSLPSSPLVARAGRQPAPFSLPDLRDPSRSVALASFRGRPVVVNFWASWCVPCRKEMPAFEQVAEELGAKVAFVGVNHQDGRGPANELLDQTGVRYPVAFDPAGKTALAYGLFGMPSTLFVAANGRLVGRHTGQMSADDLRSAIRQSFDQPGGQRSP